MFFERIVLLANSRKYSARCLAGICLSESKYGVWIRPVSDRTGEALSEFERLYVNKAEPAVLDIVDVPLIKPNPHSCQVENWLISDSRHFRKLGELSWSDTLRLAEHPESLWLNGWHTYLGVNDEIPTEYAQNLPNSICLIHVSALDLHVTTNYTGDDIKIYASFIFNEVTYKLSVTDSVCENWCRNNGFGDYSTGECLLTISLGEPFIKNNGNSCQYKLVAAIIQKPEGEM